MVCREIDGGVDWHKVRGISGKWLDEIGFQVELGADAQAPDPETWGLSPAAIEAQERAMRLGGGGRADQVPPG